MTKHSDEAIQQLKQFASHWNALYAAEKFDEMEYLAFEDIGIANSAESTDPSGLIFGRAAYKKGICDAYYGASGKENNLLIMDYQNWEYIRLSHDCFYTIGKYTLQPDIVGVNCWLLKWCSTDDQWKILRVVNN